MSKPMYIRRLTGREVDPATVDSCGGEELAPGAIHGDASSSIAISSPCGYDDACAFNFTETLSTGIVTDVTVVSRGAVKTTSRSRHIGVGSAIEDATAEIEAYGADGCEHAP